MTAGSAFVDTSVDPADKQSASSPGGNQHRPSVQSSNVSPETADLDNEFADDQGAVESESNEPVTSADEKL
jgi:hypothetical protein